MYVGSIVWAIIPYGAIFGNICSCQAISTGFAHASLLSAVIVGSWGLGSGTAVETGDTVQVIVNSETG